MTLLEKHTWEATHIIVIAGVITILTLGTCLFGVPRGKAPHVSEPAVLSKYRSSPTAITTQSIPAVDAVQTSPQQGAADAQQSDPRKVTVGPSGISNRYTLLGVERKTVSSKSDELVIRLHVESLATENLVSPFESDMLDITSPELQPINPRASFRLPVPSGNTRDQDIVFSVPPSLNLSQATLRIHYYNYQGEIPLSLR